MVVSAYEDATEFPVLTYGVWCYQAGSSTAGISLRACYAMPDGVPGPVGHYCLGGSSLPTPCTSLPGMYCPPESSAPIGVTCPVGWYCSGSSNNKMPCASEPGMYCPEGSQASNGVQCPAGWYCEGGAGDKK
eukprot:2378270-Rhodomonas_salina.2